VIDEFAAIADLLVQVYVGEGYSTASVEPDLRDVASRAHDGDVLIARDADSGALLGTVSYLTSDSPQSQIAGAGEAELRLLAVAPKARRFGAGEALVGACIERASNAGLAALVLSTQPRQRAAHRLYERMRFRRDPLRDWGTESGGLRLVYVLRTTPDCRL
jgi:ribosomal protein S18 acetylase RimI-like enzyme